MNKRKIGKDYEDMAASFLESRGYEILERNFTARRGEIDLIARDGSDLVFIEVKYRSDDRMGDPIEAVDEKKQRHLRITASYYLLKKSLPEDTPCRFDVVGIMGRNIRLVRNAF